MERYFGALGRGRISRSGMAFLALAACCLTIGCSDVGSSMSDIGSGITDLELQMRATRVDMVAQGKITAQVVSGSGIVVSLPSVFSKRDELEIFGTVTRRPDNDAPVPGFLDVQIRSKDGQLVDQSLIHWVPESIPTDGTRSARYSARIQGIPPVGSIVRVAYVEKVADLDEPLGMPEMGGTGGGAGHGGGGHSVGGGRSSHGGGGFGNSFGRH